MTRTLIIAEPGCTAEGDLATMLRQIDVAADCAVDCFKSQWTSSAERMVERRHAPEYLKFYRWLEWPVEWHEQLAARCKMRGLQYACSVYLADDARVVGLRADFLKVSSFEAEDESLVKTAKENSVQPPVISYGMDAVPDWFSSFGVKRLLCTSSYPAPIENLNLRCLHFSDEEPYFHGLSDHSAPGEVLIGALAVAAGASILETHFRLDDCDPKNPDYAVARSPKQLAEYVRNVRYAERAMGDGVKKIEECERPLLRFKVRA